MQTHGESKARLTNAGRRFNVVSASSAFFLRGGWAFYIYGGFGLGTRLISCIMRGLAGFIITLAMVRTVSRLFHHLPVNLLRFILPSLITVSTTGSCLAMAHYIAGGSGILHTISPALAVSFPFRLFTTFKLQHALARRDQ